MKFLKKTEDQVVVSLSGTRLTNSIRHMDSPKTRETTGRYAFETRMQEKFCYVK